MPSERNQRLARLEDAYQMFGVRPTVAEAKSAVEWYYHHGLHDGGDGHVPTADQNRASRILRPSNVESYHHDWQVRFGRFFRPSRYSRTPVHDRVTEQIPAALADSVIDTLANFYLHASNQETRLEVIDALLETRKGGRLVGSIAGRKLSVPGQRIIAATLLAETAAARVEADWAARLSACPDGETPQDAYGLIGRSVAIAERDSQILNATQLSRFAPQLSVAR